MDKAYALGRAHHMDHHGNDKPLFFIALCTFLSLSSSMSLTSCMFSERKYALTYNLNASDATWAGEKTVRITKNTYVKNPASSAVQNQSKNQDPVRKGYVFAGWYTEADEAKQNEATRFKFEGEKSMTPNAPNTSNAPNAPGLLTSDLTLHAGWMLATLEGVVKLGKLPSDLSPYDEVTQAALGAYRSEAGASVSAVFVTLNGGSDANKRDGKSWETAWAAAQLKEKLDGIKDASASKVVLFLVAAGEYRAGAESEISTANDAVNTDVQYWLSMKDYVAIVGGWVGASGSGSWKRGPSYVTNFKGGKAAVESQSKQYSVFYNKGLKDKATLAYATVSDGNAREGGGMYNRDSSPMLTNVTFSGNKALCDGGGMYTRWESSPTLTNVTFSGNTANNGGGMYNDNPAKFIPFRPMPETPGNHNGPSPVLTNVTFSGNSAIGGDRCGGDPGGGGGGMYNDNSSPMLTNVTFSGNTAGGDGGGGMINLSSSPTLMNVTFSGNKARHGGGGMYNRNNGEATTVVNSIFLGNTVKGQTRGAQIYLANGYYEDSRPENLNLYNCIIEGGLGLGLGAGLSSAASSSTSASLPNPLTLAALSKLTDKTRFGGIGVMRPRSNQDGGVNITHENVYDASASDTPSPSTSGSLGSLGSLGDHGGYVQTIPIAEGSFAINHGLYLRRLGENIYYSEDNSNWFIRDIPTQKKPSTLPSEAIDITATDARAYRRVGRPDIGSYEYGGVAP